MNIVISMTYRPVTEINPSGFLAVATIYNFFGSPSVRLSTTACRFLWMNEPLGL